MNAGKEPGEMSAAELAAELKRLRDALADIEETHAFTFCKTSVHIGAEMAQNMQVEYEEECKAYRDRIALLELTLKKRSTEGKGSP